MLAKAPTLKIKKLDPRAVIPFYATPGSAGMDLTAVTVREQRVMATNGDDNFQFIFGTGLAFEIPEGHVGLIFPRSSIHKTAMLLANCVGVIDSDYRGEVSFVFRELKETTPNYKVGDRVGQLVIMRLPYINILEVEELSDTERGSGGYGSTGR